MKRSEVIATAIILTAALASCSGSKTEKTEANTQEVEEVAVKEACIYDYSDAPVNVEWVAYKYTEKTAVSGKFEQVTVMPGGNGSTADALKGAKIDIATASSNSGDPTRDPKIKETFFGGLTNGQALSGVITSAEGNDASGKVTADITMNGVTKPVEGSYEVEGDKIEMKFELNVATWSANAALNALNEVCEDLHKGADGKSILWPDVTVFVTTTLNKVCS